MGISKKESCIAKSRDSFLSFSTPTKKVKEAMA